jgi:hypothetical protein
MSEENVIQISNSYYVETVGLIRQLDMNDPSSDTDERYREIWKYICNNNLKTKVVPNYDFASKLGPRTSHYYRFFQARQNCEDKTQIDDLYSQFYEDKVLMKRIIIGFEIDDKLYPFCGNHRSRAHKKGQENGYESLGHVLVLGDGLSVNDKKRHGHELAGISNRESDDDVTKENENDIVHQTKCAWEIHESVEPVTKDWTPDQKKKWAENYIMNKKPKYAAPSRKARLTRMTNQLFADHRVQSLPMPSDSEIAAEFVKFFPKNTWDPENSGKIKQRRFPSRFDFVYQTLGNMWRNRMTASPVRDKVWIAARIGDKLDAPITSIKSIESGRKSYIANLIESNTNDNHILGGYPLVERVCFVKQSELDSYEAWEWNDQNEVFDEVKSKE